MSSSGGRSDDEQPLGGGFVNAVVRVGSTVRRSTGPWTPTVHELLRYLEAAGFPESPRVLGVDERGREILTFIQGEALGWTNWPAGMRQLDGLDQLGHLLGRYHEAVRNFRPPAGAVWRNPLAPIAGELIRHGDFSPFNTVWRGDRVVGIVDWDFAQPGAALSDLAYLAWYAVPLSGNRRAGEYGFDRNMDRAARLRALCSAYGRFSPVELVEEAIAIIDTEGSQTAELARRGQFPWTRFAANGNIEAFAAEAAWIRDHRRLLVRPS